MVVTDAQEIGQVTEANHKLLAIRTRQDVIILAKSSTSPPFSDSHQHQSVINPELSFGRFSKLKYSYI